jgi:hypothetical protein
MVPAEVVATMMMLQASEGLSDREAISALRRDIAWKVACGLRLDDEGFHSTALVAGQDVEADQRPGTWRIAWRVANHRVISTVDPQGRHTRKTSAHKRDGYKAHIASEPETGLVTRCAPTAATAPDRPSAGSSCWPARRPAWRCWATPATGPGRPAQL